MKRSLLFALSLTSLLFMFTACGEVVDSTSDEIFSGGDCNGFKTACEGDSIRFCYAFKDQDKQEIRDLKCPSGCEVSDGQARCKDACEVGVISCGDDKSKYKTCAYDIEAGFDEDGGPITSQQRLVRHAVSLEPSCEAGQQCQPQMTVTDAAGNQDIKPAGCYPE